MTPDLVVKSIEYETVIRDSPPYSCACRCPAYNRDPCAACAMREVLAIEISRTDYP